MRGQLLAKYQSELVRGGEGVTYSSLPYGQGSRCDGCEDVAVARNAKGQKVYFGPAIIGAGPEIWWPWTCSIDSGCSQRPVHVTSAHCNCDGGDKGCLSVCCGSLYSRGTFGHVVIFNA